MNANIARLLLILAVAALLAGCGSQTGVSTAPRPVGPLGSITRSQLPADFLQTLTTEEIAEPFPSMISQASDSVRVLVFLGTWCSDSKHHVPRFLKIMDAANIAEERVQLYGLDRNKKSPGELEARYDITAVPTFVFLKEGKEVGRIVEAPKTTLEADILTLLAAAGQ